MKTSTKIATFQPVEKRLFIGDVNGFIMEVEIQSLRKATDPKERLNGGARVSLLRRPNRNPPHSVCHFDSQNEAIYEIFHFLFTKLTPDLTIIELDHRAFSIDGALIFGVRDSLRTLLFQYLQIVIFLIWSKWVTEMRRKQECGSSLVEAALVLPFLLLLLAGVVDLGRGYHTYITIINAAREGARVGVDYPTDETRIVSVVQQEAATTHVQILAENIAVQNFGVGNPIRVTVTVPFVTFLGGFLGMPTFPITASAAFMVR